MSKEHEHDYVAERYTVQENKSPYVGNGRYQVTILNIEKVILFCKKCGHKITDDKESHGNNLPVS